MFFLLFSTPTGLFSTLSGPTSASEGSNSIHTYSFDLGQTLGAHKMFTIEFNTAGSHTSYDAFAVVANPVPVPAAAWLFGSARSNLGLRINIEKLDILPTGEHPKNSTTLDIFLGKALKEQVRKPFIMDTFSQCRDSTRA